MSSKFRTHNNIRYTKQLFRDMQQLMVNDRKVIEPMFTLHHPYGDLPCFRLIYVSLGDPTGYQLAIRYLEDYDHWRLLMKCPWFKAAKEIWDVELNAKIESESLSTIRSIADGREDVMPATQLSAARYLADRAKPKKVSSQRGRPSKDEVDGALKAETAEAASIAADLERIRAVS